MVLNFGCSAELLRVHLRPITSKPQEREDQGILPTPPSGHPQMIPLKAKFRNHCDE